MSRFSGYMVLGLIMCAVSAFSVFYSILAYSYPGGIFQFVLGLIFFARGLILMGEAVAT